MSSFIIFKLITLPLDFNCLPLRQTDKMSAIIPFYPRKIQRPSLTKSVNRTLLTVIITGNYLLLLRGDGIINPFNHQIKSIPSGQDQISGADCKTSRIRGDRLQMIFEVRSKGRYP